MNIYLYIFIITVLFLLYVEYSVGNVFYRTNSDGNYSLHPFSILFYLLEPFHNQLLWNVMLLDINYIFVLISSLIFYHLCLK
jgi:hypothetical protein